MFQNKYANMSYQFQKVAGSCRDSNTLFGRYSLKLKPFWDQTTKLVRFLRSWSGAKSKACLLSNNLALGENKGVEHNATMNWQITTKVTLVATSINLTISSKKSMPSWMTSKVKITNQAGHTLLAHIDTNNLSQRASNNLKKVVASISTSQIY